LGQGYPDSTVAFFHTLRNSAKTSAELCEKMDWPGLKHPGGSFDYDYDYNACPPLRIQGWQGGYLDSEQALLCLPAFLLFLFYLFL
ncbi:MAG: hypothetical protein JXA03_03145, partial [Bacteroidales bacterium]|nr:hypothetical protein [Bacteroidales bacterium]